MMKNPILDELRQVRETLLAEVGGTLDALVDRLQSEERKGERGQWRATIENHPEQAPARATASRSKPAAD